MGIESPLLKRSSEQANSILSKGAARAGARRTKRANDSGKSSKVMWHDSMMAIVRQLRRR